jgi:hypothetical protein
MGVEGCVEVVAREITVADSCLHCLHIYELFWNRRVARCGNDLRAFRPLPSADSQSLLLTR